MPYYNLKRKKKRKTGFSPRRRSFSKKKRTVGKSNKTLKLKNNDTKKALASTVLKNSGICSRNRAQVVKIHVRRKTGPLALRAAVSTPYSCRFEFSVFDIKDDKVKKNRRATFSWRVSRRIPWSWPRFSASSDNTAEELRSNTKSNFF